jgi:hypothetical protein
MHGRNIYGMICMTTWLEDGASIKVLSQVCERKRFGKADQQIYLIHPVILGLAK